MHRFLIQYIVDLMAATDAVGGDEGIGAGFILKFIHF